MERRGIVVGLEQLHLLNAFADRDMGDLNDMKRSGKMIRPYDGDQTRPAMGHKYLG